MPVNAKFVVPVALGLSLVTVTAFVVYYVFKKDEEIQEKEVKTSRLNRIEIPVPKSIVPAVIGRNGGNIKEIERLSGAQVNLKEFTDKDHDVCIIRGRSDATQIAETMVHDFIKQQPVIVEDNMLVPGWAVGRIIGLGGDSITEISHRSGARVKVEGVPSGDKMTQRQISFRGTKEQIEVAMGLIDNCVAQEKCRREIEQSKRSPRHMQTPPPDHVDMPAEPSGSTIEVYVSAVSSPSRFWVQFVGPQVTQLDELVSHMTEYYGNKENRAAHALKHVSVGQVVAAVFRHDGRWYRARVHDIRPNEYDATQQVADVFFVDYGDSEYVATHELCELRADLLRLRFQAMECFLAGQRWDRWDHRAVERFEELTQVARWKALVSRTCTYKKTATSDGQKDKEIPGIKLFDVTDEGELDIGGVLIAEGWAVERRGSSPPPTPSTPFGDLGNSRVLGMLGGGGLRCSSLPKDHKDDQTNETNVTTSDKDADKITASQSLASGLETADKLKAISNFDLVYPEQKSKPHLNGSQEDFLNVERQNLELSTETLVPHTPTLSKMPLDDFKANMNRIDSHHSSLEALGRSQHDLQK